MEKVTYGDLQNACQQVSSFGHYFIALCPFHQDSSPSLLVYKDGWFRCLGCQKNGRWTTLWNKLNGQPIQVMSDKKTNWATPGVKAENLEEVCYQAHLDLANFPTLGWYMEMRGLDDRIDVNEIGYWEGWYTIPVKSETGEFETGVFRAAPHVQQATGLRYWCPHGPLMYVPDYYLMKHSKYLVIVYGMLDALTLASIRVPCVTTTGGQLTFNPEWLEDYRKRIYIVPDDGELMAARKLAKSLGWRAEVIELKYPDGIKDPAGFAEKGKKEDLARLLGGL